MVDKTFEFTTDEISLIGLVLIAIIALLHTSFYSLFIVTPIISVILTKLILFEIKNYKIKK